MKKLSVFLSQSLGFLFCLAHHVLAPHPQSDVSSSRGMSEVYLKGTVNRDVHLRGVALLVAPGPVVIVLDVLAVHKPERHQHQSDRFEFKWRSGE
jgi:hypothetical protein